MLPTDANGRIQSRGRELLIAVLQHTTTRALAKRCNLSRQAIGRLACGVATDSFRVRHSLERICGIPMTSWDEAPSGIAQKWDTSGDIQAA